MYSQVQKSTARHSQVKQSTAWYSQAQPGSAKYSLLNNSEAWYTVRRQVQQDMMRPKSALYYIAELEEIAVELTVKIEQLI